MLSAVIASAILNEEDKVAKFTSGMRECVCAKNTMKSLMPSLTIAS